MLYDAKLAVWNSKEVITEGLVGIPLYGFIFDDQKKRFKDGQRITTSLVVDVDLENNLVYTMNTTYSIIDMDDLPEFEEIRY